MADHYAPGLGGRVVVERPSERVGWRLAGSVAWFASRDQQAGGPNRDGISGGVLGGPVVGVGKAVRMSAGLGAFHEESGGRSPYALVPAAEVGVGLSVPAGPTHVDVEVRGLAVLSDLLSGAEFVPSLRVPVSVGVRF